MRRKAKPSTARSTRPLSGARQKTTAVRDQLDVASAELGLTNTVLEHHVTDGAMDAGDVRRALAQNQRIEEKVQDAADELQEVTALLEEASAQREELDKELAKRPVQ